MSPVRCPRCHRDAPDLTAFCAGCGAPLLLKDETPAGPVDAPVALDRRSRAPGASGGGLPPVELPGPAATFPPRRPAAPPARGAGPRAEELADVDASHWDLGPVAAAAAASRTEPALGAATQAPRNVVAGGGGGKPIPRAPATPIPTSTSTSIATPSSTPTSTATATPTSTPTPTPTPTPTSTSSTSTSTKATATAADLDLPDPEVDALEVHVARAEPWRRFVAWIVDGVPFLGAGGALAFYLLREAAAARGAPPQALEDLVDLVSAERVIALSVVAAVALALATYATLAHALGGATLGKRLVGIRVVGPDGGPPSPARSAIRSVLAIGSAALLGLGFLLALFTRTGRALHDVLARTWVVKAP